MLPYEWKKEIINIQKEVNWVEETTQQFLKDFNMLNLGLSFPESSPEDYASLFENATRIIKDLFHHRYSDFLNLLYRIDLPESHISSIVTNYRGEELYQVITREILLREFLKVVNRYKYAL